MDIRLVVTNLASGSAAWLYDTLYCARGQAENLIKPHKSQLASERTSCRSALANQVRLVLHTAADWLMLTVRDAIPRPQPLATAEFTTMRMRLLKIAARITETATRVRIAFAAACPEAGLFHGTALGFLPTGPWRTGRVPQMHQIPQPQRPSHPGQNSDATGAKPARIRQSGSRKSACTLNRMG